MARNLVVLLMLASAGAASAETIDATITTLVAGRQDPRDGKVYTVVPIYQLLNLSVGGMFLESSFFLKIGTKLLVTLQLPQKGREVKVKAEPEPKAKAAKAKAKGRAKK